MNPTRGYGSPGCHSTEVATLQLVAVSRHHRLPYRALAIGAVNGTRPQDPPHLRPTRLPAAAFAAGVPPAVPGKWPSASLLCKCRKRPTGKAPVAQGHGLPGLALRGNGVLAALRPPGALRSCRAEAAPGWGRTCAAARPGETGMSRFRICSRPRDISYGAVRRFVIRWLSWLFRTKGSHQNKKIESDYKGNTFPALTSIELRIASPSTYQ